MFVSFMMCSCCRTSTSSCCQNKFLKIHFYSSSIQPKLSTLASRVFLPWFIATSLPYAHLTNPSSSHSISFWYCFSCPSFRGSTFMLKPSGNGIQLPWVGISISASSRQGWESIMEERSRRTLGARGGKWLWGGSVYWTQQGSCTGELSGCGSVQKTHANSCRTKSEHGAVSNRPCP